MGAVGPHPAVEDMPQEVQNRTSVNLPRCLMLISGFLNWLVQLIDDQAAKSCSVAWIQASQCTEPTSRLCPPSDAHIQQSLGTYVPCTGTACLSNKLQPTAFAQ